MPMPAARVGDSTAHGGAILPPGAVTVLIGGSPAARVGDMHACPMTTGPVPHVGGPILVGSPTVLIGGLPAATLTSLATCTGPPDMVVGPGSPTTLIGMGAVAAPVVCTPAGSPGAAAAVFPGPVPAGETTLAAVRQALQLLTGSGLPPSTMKAVAARHGWTPVGGPPPGNIRAFVRELTGGQVNVQTTAATARNATRALDAGAVVLMPLDMNVVNGGAPAGAEPGGDAPAAAAPPASCLLLAGAVKDGEGTPVAIQVNDTLGGTAARPVSPDVIDSAAGPDAECLVFTAIPA